jgi:hypothetical protein
MENLPLEGSSTRGDGTTSEGDVDFQNEVRIFKRVQMVTHIHKHAALTTNPPIMEPPIMAPLWFCGNCGDGPYLVAINTHCPMCWRVRDGYSEVFLPEQDYG